MRASLSFSSSSNSTSSAEPVADIITKINKQNICSCIVAISEINKLSPYFRNISHAAILLLDIKIPDDDEYLDNGEYNEKKLGVLVEYGDYSPNMSSVEKNYYEKKLVFYRYNLDGGLRYYAKRINEFKKEFGNKCYIEMDISSINQITFDKFINEISPLNDKKWIKSKYSILNHNCQHFVGEALKILKPIFSLGRIQNNINIPNKKDRANNIPETIKTVLYKFKIKKNLI